MRLNTNPNQLSLKFGSRSPCRPLFSYVSAFSCCERASDVGQGKLLADSGTSNELTTLIAHLEIMSHYLFSPTIIFRHDVIFTLCRTC